MTDTMFAFHPKMLKTEDFDYELPARYIAQERVHPHEDAKLLVFDRARDEVEHHQIKDLADILTADDVLVFNDSKVMPARFWGQKATGGRIELLLVRELSAGRWLVLARPGKSIKIGTEIDFPDTELTATFIEKKERGEWIMDFDRSGADFWREVEKIGQMPTPPYIRKKLERGEENEYQTCYARDRGSAAAPTAGLHFTPTLLDRLTQKGIQTEFVTLHVGLGTFAPINDEHIAQQKLHSEIFQLDEATAARLNEAKKQGKRIIAVGTTAIRVLESCADNAGRLKSRTGETDIFIQPGYEFRFTDGMMTNFHLPQSSLLMLVSAFCGREKILEIYEIAKQENYRFFSFGDATLLL